MSSWILFIALGMLGFTAYMVGRMDGKSEVIKDAFKQHKKDDKKLKEVADEADHTIANSDTNHWMRINNWFRK